MARREKYLRQAIATARQQFVVVEVNHCIDLWIDKVDPMHHLLGNLHRRNIAAPY
jgi:hypothetical protein